MKPTAFTLIALTMLISAPIAALVWQATGSFLLAVLTYSLGGAVVMAAFAVVMFFALEKRVNTMGAGMRDWEQDRARDGGDAQSEFERKEADPQRDRNAS